MSLLADAFQPPRVAVIEQDPSLRALLVEALADEGYAVVVYPSAGGAVAAHAAAPVEVLVVDGLGTDEAVLDRAHAEVYCALGSLAPMVLFTGRTWALDVEPTHVGAHGVVLYWRGLESLLGAVQTACGGVAAPA